MRTIRFDTVRWAVDSDGAWLSLRVRDRQQAVDACGEIEAGKDYDATLKRHRERRSLDANAYCWVLCDKLADHYRISNTEVYQRQIREIGGVSAVTQVADKDAVAIARSWCAGHIGRMADDLGPCRTIPGRRNLRLWIGSSDYDTAQMSALIDQIVQECKAAGVETMTPDELLDLKSKWGAADAK